MSPRGRGLRERGLANLKLPLRREARLKGGVTASFVGFRRQSAFQMRLRRLNLLNFQSLIKNSRNSILTLGFVPHIKLVLSDIGQVSAYLLVWETAGLSDLG